MDLCSECGLPVPPAWNICPGCELSQRIQRILDSAPRHRDLRTRRGIEHTLYAHTRCCETARRAMEARPSLRENTPEVYGAASQDVATSVNAAEERRLAFRRTMGMAPPKRPRVPPGWRAVWSPDAQTFYYWHYDSSRTQWDPPSRTRSSSEPPPGIAPEPAPESIPEPLPEMLPEAAPQAGIISFTDQIWGPPPAKPLDLTQPPGPPSARDAPTSTPLGWQEVFETIWSPAWLPAKPFAGPPKPQTFHVFWHWKAMRGKQREDAVLPGHCLGSRFPSGGSTPSTPTGRTASL